MRIGWWVRSNRRRDLQSQVQRRIHCGHRATLHGWTESAGSYVCRETLFRHFSCSDRASRHWLSIARSQSIARLVHRVATRWRTDRSRTPLQRLQQMNRIKRRSSFSSRSVLCASITLFSSSPDWLRFLLPFALVCRSDAFVSTKRCKAKATRHVRNFVGPRCCNVPLLVSLSVPYRCPPRWLWPNSINSWQERCRDSSPEIQIFSIINILLSCHNDCIRRQPSSYSFNKWFVNRKHYTT